MSLSIWLKNTTPACDACGREQEETRVFERDITHNLLAMARLAGVSECMWDAKKNGIKKAQQLIEPIRLAVAAMTADPSRFRALNPSNGWGDYEGFLAALVDLGEACVLCPGADVETWR